MNQGFFKLSGLPSVTTKKIAGEKPKPPRAATFGVKHIGCDYCELYKDCRSPRMEPTGLGKRGILVIAEAPGNIEDEQGAQLVGRAGQLLRDSLWDMGIHLDRDCWKTNSVQCRPMDARGSNRTPTSKEIGHCRSRVWGDIERLKPKVIILLGNVALESFLGGRWKKDMGGITRWRGWTIPDRDVKAWVCPTFHPSFVMRSEGEPVVRLVFEQDLQQAVDYAETPFPDYGDEISQIKILPTPRETELYLKSLNKECPDFMAFDFETSGLKPYREGHFIRTCAISTRRGTTAFSVYDNIKPALKELLENPKIGKSAHNLKFEDLWGAECLDALTESWAWCSQTVAHILDGRGKISSLKFQAYVRFGIIDYDSDIAHFLKSPNDKDSNAFNRIAEAPLDKLLTYNGVDALLGGRLTSLQMKETRGRGLDKACELFREGLISLAELEQTGFKVDTEYLNTQHDNLTQEIKDLHTWLLKSKEGKIWAEVYGDKLKLDSPPQLSNILFNHLNVKSIKKTEKGNDSVDESVLGKIKLPFVKKLVQLRKIKKNLNTYLDSYRREEVNGIVHPFYHLNIARSYRSSSSRPNAQNIPVRDKDANKLIRSAIIPRPGNQIIDIDFKGMEVSTAACVTQDPQLIKYLRDPSTDMHRDMAMQIFLLKEDEVSPNARYCGKNNFVFPQFYGDWYESCAKTLWENMTDLELKVEGQGTPMREHLSSNGIKSYNRFVNHIEDVQDDFWGRRFKVYNQWKQDQWKQYQKLGYIDLVTGFRCTEIMRKNMVLNRPIQGPAFHILLWTLNRLMRARDEEKWKSELIMQVHDNTVLDLVPNELDGIVKTLDTAITEELPKEWPWITVPLSVSYAITPIDGSWYTKREVSVKDLLNA